jgi:hypothetical protein
MNVGVTSSVGGMTVTVLVGVPVGAGVNVA